MIKNFEKKSTCNERKNQQSERDKLIIAKVERKWAEVVESTPFELTNDEKAMFHFVKSQMNKLTCVVQQENRELGNVVAQQT